MPVTPETKEKQFMDWLKKNGLSKSISSYVSALSGKKQSARELLLEFEAPLNLFKTTDLKYLEELRLKIPSKQELLDKGNKDGGFLKAGLKHYIQFLREGLNSDSSEEVISMNRKNLSLNQVLYGPPGTGKTYNTVSKALEILGSSTVPEFNDREPKSILELKKAFPGQVEFVTFHQSFSYEDFVEGLRASSSDGHLSYEVEDGIFKKLCVEAMFSKLKNGDKYDGLNFSEIYDQFLLIVKDKLKEGPYLLESKSEKPLYLRKVSDRDTLKIFHEGSEVVHSVGRKRLKRLYDVYPDFERFHKIKNIHNEITEAIGGANSTVYWAVLNKLLSLKQEIIEQQDYDNSRYSLSYEQKKQELEDIETSELKQGMPHVLIIDEINRGNISRIFGELITLIEASKRQGCEEAISVQLPYSKESFSVPDNLFIIGSMNTADRSLAMMDTALRRRFDFIEMMPKPELLKNYGLNGRVEGVKLEQLLTVINQRIEALYDREHTIGHAFFMTLDESSTIDDLANIFENKILPLLEEYFYDDWDKIRLVLADQVKNESDLQFYREVEKVVPEGLFPNSNVVDIKKSYRRKVPIDAQAYIQIYTPNGNHSSSEA